jgi:DNA repair protein RecO (recombination protein O)
MAAREVWEGIVLQSRDFGEGDRLLNVLTREQGMVRLLARGVRRILSRRAGHLELFVKVKIGVAAGRSFGIITEAVTLQSYRRLRTNESALQIAFSLARWFLSLLPPEQPQVRLYEVLGRAFDELNAGSPSRLVYLSALLELLKYSGFGLALKYCAVCQCRLSSHQYAWSAIKGGLLCGDCGRKLLRRPSAPSVVALVLLRVLQRTPFGQLKRINAPPAAVREAAQLLHERLGVISQLPLSLASKSLP